MEPVHLTEPVLGRLLEYWQEGRVGRLVPLWSAIDPVEIPWALRYLWICDFEPTTRRFRYRLSGEDINRVYGFNLRGRYLEQIVTADGWRVVHDRYLTVIETPAIVTVRGSIYLRSDRLLRGERLMLPLSRTGEAVDMLLGATVAAEHMRQFDQDVTHEAQETSVAPLFEPTTALGGRSSCAS